MERIIKLNNTSLLIKNDISEYDDILIKRLLMFDDAYEYKNFIIIKYDKTIINLNGKKTIINKKLVHTDLYQLINNSISNLINNSSNLYIHSSIIQNDKNTILILGDFNVGKTLLSRYAKGNGYKIISADQSWLVFDKFLRLHKGSLYMAYDNTYEILDRLDSNQKIDKILILQGINDGTLKYFDNNNYYHNIKQLTKYCTWSTNNILMSDDIELTLDKKLINDFIKNVNIPIVYASGKPCDIINKMEEI